MTSRHVFVFEGQARTVSDIARRVGMPNGTLHHRLVVMGLPIEEAISKPVTPKHRLNPEGRKPRLYWFRGESRSIRDVAAELGVHPETIRRRTMGDRILEADEAKAIPCERGADERLITFRSITRNTAEWARVSGIAKHALHSRLDMGWTIARALTTPVAHKRKTVIRRMSTAFRRSRIT